MSQNIEIEFKNMLNEEEFHSLIKHFKLVENDFKKQINHYFDTPAFSLKDHGSALRIREKGSLYEMTLKQPAEQGLLETNQWLTAGQAENVLATGTLLDGEVKDAVKRMIRDAGDIQYFGSLTTERAELEYQGGLLVLDHSYYLNSEDYELEYEVTDEAKGYKIFLALLKDLNIPKRPTDNKIKRFYSKKYNLLQE